MPAAIRADAKPLAAAISRVLPAVERRVTIPVLAMVHLVSGEDVLTISGNDLDMQIDVRNHPIEGGPGFDVCVDPRNLIALLRQLGGEVVKLSTDGAALAVIWSDGEASLPTLPGGDFPTFSCGDVVGSGSLPSTIVTDALDRVSASISTDECRYYLNGACIDKDADGRGVIVSTDGHRLTVVPVPGLLPLSDTRPILPHRFVKAWMGAGRGQAATLTVHDKGRVSLELGDLLIRSKTIDGTYPDWKRVVPASAPGLRFARSDLQMAVGRLSALGHDKSPAVRIERSPAGAVMTTSRTFGANMKQTIPVEGAAGPFALNLRYLLSALRGARGQFVTITVQGETDPLRVVGDEDPAGCIHVLMPVRTEAPRLAKAA